MTDKWYEIRDNISLYMGIFSDFFHYQFVLFPCII